MILCVRLCMLGVPEGRLCLLEVLEMLEVMRRVLLSEGLGQSAETISEGEDSAARRRRDRSPCLTAVSTWRGET